MALITTIETPNKSIRALKLTERPTVRHIDRQTHRQTYIALYGVPIAAKNIFENHLHKSMALYKSLHLV